MPLFIVIEFGDTDSVHGLNFWFIENLYCFNNQNIPFAQFATILLESISDPNPHAMTMKAEARGNLISKKVSPARIKRQISKSTISLTQCRRDVSVGRARRTDIELLDEEIEHVRADKSRERRSELDIFNTEV
jgi:hypothetical protein